MVVNLETKTTLVNGTPVHFILKEYQMLELLSLRKGTTLSKEMFLNHLYGGTDEPEQKIIDVFMCKLRKKLAGASGGKDYIETVWGRSYVLRLMLRMAASAPRGRDHYEFRSGSASGGKKFSSRQKAHRWRATG